MSKKRKPMSKTPVVQEDGTFQKIPVKKKDDNLHGRQKRRQQSRDRHAAKMAKGLAIILLGLFLGFGCSSIVAPVTMSNSGPNDIFVPDDMFDDEATATTTHATHKKITQQDWAEWKMIFDKFRALRDTSTFTERIYDHFEKFGICYYPTYVVSNSHKVRIVLVSPSEPIFATMFRGQGIHYNKTLKAIMVPQRQISDQLKIAALWRALGMAYLDKNSLFDFDMKEISAEDLEMAHYVIAMQIEVDILDELTEDKYSYILHQIAGREIYAVTDSEEINIAHLLSLNKCHEEEIVYFHEKLEVTLTNLRLETAIQIATSH